MGVGGAGVSWGLTPAGVSYPGGVTLNFGAFHPTDLTGLVALYDVSDLTSLKVERTGAAATTPASVDGVVGTVLDRSGKGKHWTAPSDAARPILRQSGGLYYLEFDGVDDGLQNLSTNLSATSHLVHAIDLLSDTQGLLLYSDAAFNQFIAVYDPGGGASATGSAAGSPTYHKNSATFGGATRSQLHSFIVTGAPILFEARNFDASLWGGQVKFGNYPTGFQVAGRLYATALFSSVLTGDDLFNLQQWMAAKAGITL